MKDGDNLISLQKLKQSVERLLQKQRILVLASMTPFEQLANNERLRLRMWTRRN